MIVASLTTVPGPASRARRDFVQESTAGNRTGFRKSAYF